MDKFEIALKNEKRKSINTSLLVIIFLNIIAFLFVAYIAEEDKSRNIALFAAGFVTIALLLNFFLKKRIEYDGKIVVIALIIYFYLRTHLYFPALAMVIMTALYFITTKVPVVVFTKKGISYPSFPKKNIHWPALNNVILKDGLLTIDFKNNKLIQQYVETESADVNEQEFNEFCRQQLISNQ